MSVALDDASGIDGRALGSKLRAPRLQPNALRRSGLLGRLGSLSPSVTLVSVQAPAGFGKTTVARQWIETDPRPAAWLALDEGDDDPVALLRQLVTALDTATPLPRTLAAAYDTPPALDLTVMPTLDRELQGAGSFVLVLDDVHRLRRPETVALIDRIADLVPEGSTLVLCSRSEPAVHLARRHLAGTVAELGWRDLAFTTAEASDLVEAVRPGLDGDLVEALLTRADGWPAGLQLALLALERHQEPNQVVAILAESDEAARAYFRQELLASLSDDQRWFLLRTAVLETPNGALCDHVLETTGSGERLADLAASGNLFVSGLDHDRAWYRYHHVFQHLLLTELRLAEPDVEPVLRRRAAAWLAANGQPEAAVDQAIATGDAEFAGELMASQLPFCLNDGRLVTLQRWVEAFDADQIRAVPALAVCAAWVVVSTRRNREVRHWFAGIDPSHDAERPLPRSAALGRDALLLASGHLGMEASLLAARRIVEAGSDDNEWYPLGLLFQALLEHQLGQVDDPRQAFQDAEFATRGQPATHLVALSQMAIVKMLRFDPARGQALAQQAAAECEARHLGAHPLLPIVRIALGLARAQQGRADWRTPVSEGLDLIGAQPEASPRAQAQLRLVAAEAALAGGDVELAGECLDHARPHLAQLPDTARLHTWADDLHLRIARRRNPRLPAGGPDLTKAERAVLDQLATHRTLEEIGETLYVSRNTVKSHTIAIYRKLGVSGRSAAVEQGRALGLLDAPAAGGITRSG